MCQVAEQMLPSTLLEVFKPAGFSQSIPVRDFEPVSGISDRKAVPETRFWSQFWDHVFLRIWKRWASNFAAGGTWADCCWATLLASLFGFSFCGRQVKKSLAELLMSSPGCNIRHISKAHVFTHQAVQPFFLLAAVQYILFKSCLAQTTLHPGNVFSAQSLTVMTMTATTAMTVMTVTAANASDDHISVQISVQTLRSLQMIR